MIEARLQELQQSANQIIGAIDAALPEEVGPPAELYREQRQVIAGALEEASRPRTHKIAVVGSFKVGKSSFVNALLDRRNLAAVDANPETAAVTVFRHGEAISSRVQMLNRASWEQLRQMYEQNNSDDRAARYAHLKRWEKEGRLNPPLAELESQLIAEQPVVVSFDCADWGKDRKKFSESLRTYTSRNNPRHYLVDHVAIHVPVPLLEGGVELIDTPGLDDPDRYRVRITEDYVRDVDVILFLTASGHSYSQSDKDFLVRLLRLRRLKHLRLVVTKCDETFASAKRDARDRDEEPPTYEEHTGREELRIRRELEVTLEELLRERGVSDEERGYFEGLLTNVPIDFISSHHYADDRHAESGIPELRKDIERMLEEGERAVRARTFLREAVERVSERLIRSCAARTEAATKEYDLAKVKQRSERVAEELNGLLDGMEEALGRIVAELRRQNEAARQTLEGTGVARMLHPCDEVVREYEQTDLQRTWQSRRQGYWGYLDDMAERVASLIFPRVDLALRPSVEAFTRALHDIQTVLARTQVEARALQQKHSLGEGLRPLDLTRSFEARQRVLVQSLEGLTESLKDDVMRRLGEFVTEEVSQEVEERRERVTAIRGKGTMEAQADEVRAFYRFLRDSLRKALSAHLKAMFRNFGGELEQGLKPIGPEMTQELQDALQDRLDALESRLMQQNQQQKERLIARLKGLLASLQEARGRLQPLAAGSAQPVKGPRERVGS